VTSRVAAKRPRQPDEERGSKKRHKGSKDRVSPRPLPSRTTAKGEARKAISKCAGRRPTTTACFFPCSFGARGRRTKNASQRALFECARAGRALNQSSRSSMNRTRLHAPAWQTRTWRIVSFYLFYSQSRAEWLQEHCSEHVGCNVYNPLLIYTKASQTEHVSQQ
jgi:hypothetical protein